MQWPLMYCVHVMNVTKPLQQTCYASDTAQKVWKLKKHLLYSTYNIIQNVSHLSGTLLSVCRFLWPEAE